MFASLYGVKHLLVFKSGSAYPTPECLPNGETQHTNTVYCRVFPGSDPTPRCFQGIWPGYYSIYPLVVLMSVALIYISCGFIPTSTVNKAAFHTNKHNCYVNSTQLQAFRVKLTALLTAFLYTLAGFNGLSFSGYFAFTH